MALPLVYLSGPILDPIMDKDHEWRETVARGLQDVCQVVDPLPTARMYRLYTKTGNPSRAGQIYIAYHQACLKQASLIFCQYTPASDLFDLGWAAASHIPVVMWVTSGCTVPPYVSRYAEVATAWHDEAIDAVRLILDAKRRA